MRIYSLILCGIASCALLASCRKQTVTGPAIGFGVEADRVVCAAIGSKAGAGSDEISDKSELRAFGVYASLANDSESEGNILMGPYAVRVYPDPLAPGNWKYDNLKYWEHGKHYRFRAYHPYDGSFNVYNYSDTDNISVEYKIGESQDDLMFAFASVAASGTTPGKVLMRFQHALAALEFNIKFADGLDSEDAITSFHLKGLRPSGMASSSYVGDNLHTSRIRWSGTGYFEEYDEFFLWGSAAGKAFSADSPARIFDGDGLVFVIPQEVEEGRTSVHFTLASTSEHEFHVTLPPDTWEIGKKYVYTLTLRGSEADVDVTIKPWELLETVFTINL